MTLSARSSTHVLPKSWLDSIHPNGLGSLNAPTSTAPQANAALPATPQRLKDTTPSAAAPPKAPPAIARNDLSPSFRASLHNVIATEDSSAFNQLQKAQRPTGDFLQTTTPGRISEQDRLRDQEDLLLDWTWIKNANNPNLIPATMQQQLQAIKVWNNDPPIQQNTLIATDSPQNTASTANIPAPISAADMTPALETWLKNFVASQQARTQHSVLPAQSAATLATNPAAEPLAPTTKPTANLNSLSPPLANQLLTAHRFNPSGLPPVTSIESKLMPSKYQPPAISSGIAHTKAKNVALETQIDRALRIYEQRA